MSNCDCQENIDDDEATVTAVVAEKPVGDGLLITIVAATTVGIGMADVFACMERLIFLI